MLAAQLPTWIRLCPVDVLAHPVLGAAAELLAAPETASALHAGQLAGAYPADTVAALQRLGLARLFTREADVFHLCGLNALAARCDGSLAITLGVNALALLPVYLDAAPALRERVFARFEGGALAAMLLTELANGSNLLRNEASATPFEGGFRLAGEKHLINGGTRHDLLLALMRTGRGGGVAFGDFTLLLVERDASVEALPRWSTLPARAADIAGVRFHGTVVGEDAVIGKVGDGFGVVQRLLSLSRGGISALASGCASGAAAHALHHARTRDVYGAPIVRLDAIADHLARLAELDLIVACTAIKASMAANLLGPGAAIHTAVAKLVSCALAEEAVDHGRRVLGSRALLADQPYERFVRDVLLYGVFDGTSHVMLNELSLRLPQIAAGGRASDEAPLERARRIFAAPPRPLSALGEQRAPVRHVDLAAYVRALAELEGEVSLAPLCALTDALLSTTRTLRARNLWSDQGLRFAVTEAFAWLEAAIATVELCDAPRRAALGAPPAATGPELAPVYAGALAGLGLRIAARLHEVADLTELDPPELAAAERALGKQRAAVRLPVRAWLQSA